MCWGVEKCGEVWGEERGGVGEMWGKMGRGSHIPYISPHFSHTPTHFPHLPPHLFSHLPPHFSTPSPTLPHSFHIPPMLDPTPRTTKNFPITPLNSPKLFITPYSSPYSFPRTTIVTLSFTPHQNFLLFSFIAKLVQQSKALETPCKFHKKNLKTKIKNGNAASKL